MRQYPFTLVFEQGGIRKHNYVTETVYWALASGSIPVYIGAPNIDYFVPHMSTIIPPYKTVSGSQIDEENEVQINAEKLASILRDIVANHRLDTYQQWRTQAPEDPLFNSPYKNQMKEAHNVDNRPAITSASGIENGICRICAAMHRPNYRLALVMAFRGRDLQLPRFTHYMNNWLSAQALPHDIYVIEQGPRGLFNKGRIFNAGFKVIFDRPESKNFDICFHDIDYLPRNDLMSYGDVHSVRQPIQRIDCRAPPSFKAGGVVCMNRTVVEAVNGWSNAYWGWGQV